MGIRPVDGGIDVHAAGDHEPVDPVEQLAGLLGGDGVGRQQHGDGAGTLHGVVVGARHDRQDLVPGAVARLLDGGADPYQRPRHPGNVASAPRQPARRAGISWRRGRAARGPALPRSLRRRRGRRRRGRRGDRARADPARRLLRACWRRGTTSAPAPARRTPRSCTPASTRSPAALESKLVARGYELLSSTPSGSVSPRRRSGRCWSPGRPSRPRRCPAIAQNAGQNGVRVRRVGVDELYRREPSLGPGAHGGLEVPAEGILCPFTATSPSPQRRCSAAAALALRAEVTGVSAFTGDDGGATSPPANRAGGRAGAVPRQRSGPTQRRGRTRCSGTPNSGAPPPRRADRLRQARERPAAPRAAAGADREDEGGAGLAHRLRQRAAGPDGRRRPQQDGPLDHGGRPRLAARTGRAHPPRPRRPRGDRHLRRPAGRDRGLRLPAALPPRAALRLRGRHPLHRRHRLDGDRRARARRAGRSRAGAGEAAAQDRAADAQHRRARAAPLSARRADRRGPGAGPHRLLLRARHPRRDRRRAWRARSPRPTSTACAAAPAC